MSVRNALLALVAQQPAGVYRLKQMLSSSVRQGSRAEHGR